jgi:hypothetical protein
MFKKKTKKVLTVASSFEILRPHTEKHNTSHMRTKTLLLTAALAAAASAGMAQSTIYSVNAVGYINRKVVGKGAGGTGLAAQGFTGIAGAFEADTTLQSLIPDGSANVTGFLKATSFSPDGLTTFVDSYDKANDDFWANGGGMVIRNGDGVVIENFGGDFTVTLVGQVKQSVGNTPISNPINQGPNLVSSAVPQEDTLTNLGLGAPDKFISTFRWLADTDPAGAGVQISHFDPADGFWDPVDPVIHVGESFFINSPNGSVAWDRVFHVN